VEIDEFQRLIARTYMEKDTARGRMGTYAWLVEEVGELSRALRKDDRESLREEFADVLAWLVSLANLCEIEMEEAAMKYAKGCPKCHNLPCSCPE
jgi:NTP pyrophosphatase (non-canonical NTP hydrolase)